MVIPSSTSVNWISIALGFGLALFVASNQTALGQAGSTGGTIGKMDKSLSGGVEEGSSISDARERIAQFIEWELLQDKEHYDREVDYFNKGLVSREVAMQDHAAYVAKWPTRKYSLIPNTLQIVAEGAGLYSTTFGYSYQVSDGRKTLNGEARSLVKLKIGDGEILVIAIKEIIQRGRSPSARN
jgi:hypothetical protein